MKRGYSITDARAWQLKAWHVFDRHPTQSSLLVFADSAARARSLAFNCGARYCVQYIDIRARRAVDWDSWAIEERVIENNEETPPGAPKFYDDDNDFEFSYGGTI